MHGRHLQTLGPERYAPLLRDSSVLERDDHGGNVLLTPDGRIVKLFRGKRRLSSAVLRPYAERFHRNAVRLREMGIRTVSVAPP
jgi:hypothetical protein